MVKYQSCDPEPHKPPCRFISDTFKVIEVESFVIGSGVIAIVILNIVHSQIEE